MSNHLIQTKDNSEAFFARWICFDFPNSRLKSGKPIDTNLAKRIIDSELPGIAFWAIEGAKRVIAQDGFSKSIAHDHMMTKWRMSVNSISEFIHDECALGKTSKYRIKRSEFYEEYKTWCGDNGRKAFSKGKVKDLLAHNITLGISHHRIGGIEYFDGVCLKFADTETSAKNVTQSPSGQDADGYGEDF